MIKKGEDLFFLDHIEKGTDWNNVHLSQHINKITDPNFLFKGDYTILCVIKKKEVKSMKKPQKKQPQKSASKSGGKNESKQKSKRKN